jgi:hypothetical protein
MTTKKFAAKHKFALASFLATLSLASSAQLPDGEFACQVMTESGQSGLVLVQTDAEADAVRAARAAIAWEMDGGEGKAISVVECITFPGGKFKDSRFNSFYKDFPL